MSVLERGTPREQDAGTQQCDGAPGPELTNFHARVLLQMVEQLQIRFTYEQSVRLCQHALLSNRFLLTITKDEIRQNANDTILALCRRLGMPEPLRETTSDNLNQAKFVHFGFEEDQQSCLYKVYLEFGLPAAEPGPTFLLHLALKWDIADASRYVQTKYIWHPRLNPPMIAERLAQLYHGGASQVSQQIVQGIVEFAASKPNHGMKYLEVTEDANGRHSFDLNLYDAQLRVQDLEPWLLRMREHFSIPADQFQALYDQIKDRRFGHLAGGVHRNGQEFFNLYYGAERRHGKTQSARAGWATGNVKRLQHTSDQDQYYNYCWWPYLPVAPTENKYRPVNLLLHSFETARVNEGAVELVDKIRAEIGPFRTVWGTKWLPTAPTAPGQDGGAVTGQLAWEFYFYDYQRRQREVSITRLLKAIRPIVRCDVPANEGLPYFMFSLDVNDQVVSGARELDVVHMYVGNPGSRVSSGIAYAVTAAGATLENFYFFFDAKRDLREAAEKIFCSAHVDSAQIDIDRLLIPELRNCHTICVANKQKNDTVYFSGVNVDQLLFFLKWLRYPTELIGFVETNRDKLDHLLYDVGFDYVAKGSELKVVKSGYYGVF